MSAGKRRAAIAAYYLASFAGMALLLYGIDWGSRLLLAAGSALLAVWAGTSVAVMRRWWLASVAEGGYLCFIWQWRGRMVHHLHWLKKNIVACRNSAGFAGKWVR